MKHKIQKMWGLMALLIVGVMLVTSCATPTPVTIIETVEVEVERTVEVIKTVEVQTTVEVQVTQAPDPSMPVLNADVSGEIEMWHWWASPVRRNAVRRVIAICQEQLPNIKVTDTVKPFGDVWTANVAAVAAGSGMPDVIVSDRPTLPKDAADGVYMDLQEWADRDNVTRDMFYGWAWDQSLYEEHTYGIPFETDVRVLFWNKQAFTDAGLDPNTPPKTWEDLWAMADKLDKKNDDGTYSQIAFFPMWNAGFNPFWAYLNGARLINDDGTPALNDPKAVEAVEWIKKWVDRYGGWQALENFKAQYNAAPPNDLFMSGHVAMITDIFGYNSQLEFYRPRYTMTDETTPRVEWGIGMLPNNEGAEPANWSGGFSLSIPSGAENAEAAWEFIKCMSSAEGQASWARDTGAQPPQLEAASDPVLLAVPNYNIVDESLKVSSGGVFVAKYPNWGEQLDLVLPKVWTGEMTAQEALDAAQQAVLDALNQ